MFLHPVFFPSCTCSQLEGVSSSDNYIYPRIACTHINNLVMIKRDYEGCVYCKQPLWFYWLSFCAWLSSVSTGLPPASCIHRRPLLIILLPCGIHLGVAIIAPNLNSLHQHIAWTGAQFPTIIMLSWICKHGRSSVFQTSEMLQEFGVYWKLADSR